MKMRCLGVFSFCLTVLLLNNTLVAQQEGDSRVFDEIADRLNAIEMFHVGRGGMESMTMTPDRALVDEFGKLGEKGIQWLINSSNSENRHVQLHSVLILGELGEPGELALLGVLKDSKSTARAMVMNLVGSRLRSYEFLEVAEELVESDDPALSTMAISVLGRARFEPAIDTLEKLLAGTDKDRSNAAAYALAMMGIDSGVHLMCESMNNDQLVPFAKAKLSESLGMSGSPKAINVLLEVFEEGMLRTSVDDRIPGMVYSPDEHESMMTSENPRGAGLMLASKSSSAIQQIGFRREMPQLVKGLEHENQAIRTMALRALTVGDPTAAEGLLDYRDRANDDEIPYLIQALARTRDPRVFEPLRQWLNGEHGDLVLTALAVAGDESVRPQLLKSMDASDPQSEVMAAFALSGLATDKDVDELFKLLERSSVRSTGDIVSSIGLTFNPSATQRMKEWTSSQTNPRLITSGLLAIACTGDDDSAPFLESYLQHEDFRLRNYASLAVYVLNGEKTEFLGENGERKQLAVLTYFIKYRLRKLDRLAK